MKKDMDKPGGDRAEDVVRGFIAAWNRNDMLAVLDYLTEDVHYHNMPIEPLDGKAAVAGFLDSLGPIDTVDWTLHNIVSKGDIVLTERTDRFVVSGTRIQIPVMGAFELRGDKIAAWRDYFDLATFTRQLASPLVEEVR